MHMERIRRNSALVHFTMESVRENLQALLRVSKNEIRAICAGLEDVHRDVVKFVRCRRGHFILRFTEFAERVRVACLLRSERTCFVEYRTRMPAAQGVVRAFLSA